MLYPTVDIAAGFAKTRGSAAGFGFPYGIPGMDSSLYQIGFDASYEVDLFGGCRGDPSKPRGQLPKLQKTIAARFK